MMTRRMASRVGRSWFAPFLLASASVAVLPVTASAQPADAPSAPDPRNGAGAAAANDVAADAAASAPKPAAASAAPATSTAPAQAASTKSEADAAADEAAAAAAAATVASASSGGGEEPRLNLYGFTDLTFVSYTKTPATGNPNSNFFIGNLNLYMGTDWGDNWRSLAEVRFMYLPDGTTVPGGTSRWDTSVPDYTSNAVPISWGGISIQRVWLEHTLHPLLTIRAGQFLTPYGIWNVDHGSPTIIGIDKPLMVSNGLFPESQTGLEIYGALTSGATQLGYHLTLSNGRGPYDKYMDLDSNKGLGGRLFVRNESIAGTITAGISGYTGMYTNSHDQTTVVNGTTTALHIIDTQYNEQSLAGDLKWQVAGLSWQSEVVMNQVAFTDGGRTVSAKGLAADYRNWGIYSLAGYRLPFFGIMPYGCIQYYTTSASGSQMAAANGGLNIRMTPRVVLKGQFMHIWSVNNSSTVPAKDKIELQAAWSF